MVDMVIFILGVILPVEVTFLFLLRLILIIKYFYFNNDKCINHLKVCLFSTSDGKNRYLEMTACLYFCLRHSSFGLVIFLWGHSQYQTNDKASLADKTHSNTQRLLWLTLLPTFHSLFFQFPILWDHLSSLFTM
jgi:hypothetical protein